jgi:hypothetical protein
MDPRPVTICVLTYGNYPDLVKRTIESIRFHCARSLYRLVVGANAAGAGTREYLERLRAEGAIDRLILSEANLNKCPMMRRMFEGIEGEFVWWFDDDSHLTGPEALFFFGSENDFNYGTDVAGYVRRAPWFRGKEPPSWTPGGKGEFNFEGKGTGDGRWFFVTGGCWFIRSEAIRALDWPDPGLIKRNDDVFLCEALRQQGWEFHDIGLCGAAINTEPRRGEGEDKATMERQMSVR